jgi:hypothetical protein
MLGVFTDDALTDPAEGTALGSKGASCSESVDRLVLDFSDNGTDGNAGEGP